MQSGVQCKAGHNFKEGCKDGEGAGKQHAAARGAVRMGGEVQSRVQLHNGVL